MSNVTNHSWVQSTILINGVTLQQFDGGDDVISFERRVDMATDVMGASGDMVVSLGTDKSGIVSFRLLQTSDSNVFLRTLANTQDAGIFTELSLSYTNNSTGEVVYGIGGYFQKQSGKTRGVQSNAQSWDIVFSELQFIDL